MSDQSYDVLIKTMTHFHKTIQFAQVSGQILFVVHMCQYHHSRTERWQEKQRLCSLGQLRVPCKTLSLDVASSRKRLINGLCQTHLAVCASVVTKVDIATLGSWSHRSVQRPTWCHDLSSLRSLTIFLCWRNLSLVRVCLEKAPEVFFLVTSGYTYKQLLLYTAPRGLEPLSWNLFMVL